VLKEKNKIEMNPTNCQEALEVVAELPGVEKKDIKLHATEDSLEIRTENEKKFFREIPFDMPVKPKTAKATYKNGVLSVRITKKEGKKKTTYIVRVSEERAWREGGGKV